MMNIIHSKTLTINEIALLYENLGNYVTKDLDKLNKKLIKEKMDVSILKNVVLNEQKYHRTYFQVSMGLLSTTKEKLNFIEDNYLLLQDWWHVDQLTQFIKDLDLSIVYDRAKEYVNNKHPFLRRWGYVIFMPTLVKDENSFDLITSLLKNDDEYYVIMAEAWLISYLAIYYPIKTFNYLNNCNLNYAIVGKAIQKICDSYRISNEFKAKFKEIRKKYK